MNLTPEQLAELRVRMAEADGWKNIRTATGHPLENVYSGEPDDDWNRDVASGDMGPYYAPHREEVLDYLTDLNAIHRLEEKLTPEQWTDYINQLYYITFTPGAKDRDKAAVHAKAEHKCLALDRTLNPTNPIV